MKEYQVEDFLPEGVAGEYRIERFAVSPDVYQRPQDGYVPPGTYTRLMRGETIVMSDTPDEWRDHIGFVYAAKGQVLVAGLGIGMVVRALLRKPEVTHVTVIELSPEVIGLTAPHLKALYGDRLEVIQGDILTWVPSKDARWDCAWYDIWDGITPDNLPDMKRLHRRFGRRGPRRDLFNLQCGQRPPFPARPPQGPETRMGRPRGGVSRPRDDHREGSRGSLAG